MSVGIGIDTGGTYTDAVAYDFETREILAKGKALTTKENLAIGIGEALDFLPLAVLAETKVVALSTTLATNACVEDKGSRAKLILIGTSQKVLEWIDAEGTYGLRAEDILCVETKGSFDGKIVGEPDWEQLLVDSGDWLKDADALSVAEIYAFRNGSVCERNAKAILEAHCQVPVVLGSELASGLGMMGRGATALLNARLLPVIHEFIEAVAHAFKQRGIQAKAMIVRSDGSLMSEQLSRHRPVETILSGPAASVLGGKGLTACQDCLIVDMGGTTTDISIVKGGVPVMVHDGIQVGRWRTQVAGVFMDTFALGGDSAIRVVDGRPELSRRRVLPLSLAAVKWPAIKEALRQLLDSPIYPVLPLHEFLYLVREPKDLSRYNRFEQALCEHLKAGPSIVSQAARAVGLDVYHLNSERLETEGVVMRCGLTPTDLMHIKGDFSAYDQETARLAVRCFLKGLPQYPDHDDSLLPFADEVYDRIKQRLYENIVRILLTNRYPKLLETGLDEQLQSLISQRWTQRMDDPASSFFNLELTTTATLIGIGAPTHVFLPDVAKALGTHCTIPEHAEVANAVGAILADITTKVQVEISPILTAGGIIGYTVHAPGGRQEYPTLEEASQAATRFATQGAIDEARRRGALGALSVQTDLSPHVAHAKDGMEVDLGTSAVAIATGRIES